MLSLLDHQVDGKYDQHWLASTPAPVVRGVLEKDCTVFSFVCESAVNELRVGSVAGCCIDKSHYRYGCASNLFSFFCS